MRMYILSFKFLPMIDSTYPIFLAAEELRYAAQAVDYCLVILDPRL